jgi:hypothetical protein
MTLDTKRLPDFRFPIWVLALFCALRRSESSILTLIIIFRVYSIQKWGQNLKKMGFGYEYFNPKMRKSNILKYSGFATRFQRRNR